MGQVGEKDARAHSNNLWLVVFVFLLLGLYLLVVADVEGVGVEALSDVERFGKGVHVLKIVRDFFDSLSSEMRAFRYFFRSLLLLLLFIDLGSFFKDRLDQRLDDVVLMFLLCHFFRFVFLRKVVLGNRNVCNISESNLPLVCL